MFARYIGYCWVLLLIAMMGCDASDPGLIEEPEITAEVGTLNRTLLHDGQERSYVLYVPDSYRADRSFPLLFNFHGYTSDATAQMWYGDFRPIADTAGFIIIHPQGTLLNGNTHWNVGGWTLGSTVDDVGFTEALIDELANVYNVDRNRVYSTGMSNGGYMSFLLACQLSEKIAAVASVTGSMTPEIRNECEPTHPMPVLQIHGTADAVVPYGGAIWTVSIEQVISYWAEVAECDPTADKESIPDINPTDGSTVERESYSCRGGQAEIEHYRVLGGGHTWPGSAFGSVNETNYDIDASARIWDFFNQFDLEGLR